jgi:hypothetical protein
MPTFINNETAQAPPRHKPWWEGFYERRNAGLENQVTDQPPIGMEAYWPGYSGGGGGHATPWVSDVNVFNVSNEHVQVAGTGVPFDGSGFSEPTARVNEQHSRLSAECMREVQLHIHILTSYFAHTLRHQCKDVAPARAQAVQHWIDSAKHWESGVSEACKARLPTASPTANAIQGIMCRQIRIHAMTESQRRRSLGMNWNSSDAWRADINAVAFKEQARLMKSWTCIFDAMLQDLRSRCPLPDDAVQEFQGPGGWSHLLDADGKAKVDGV